MRWRFFDLQRIIDEVLVDDWLYPWHADAGSSGASQ